MKLPSIPLALSLLGLLLGCGGNKPEAPPAKSDPAKLAPSSSAGPETGSKEPGAATKDPSPSENTTSKETTPKVQGPPEPPKRADEELRGIAARLVEKSPTGSWRINTAAELDLERLGEKGQAGLVALLGDAKSEVRRGAAYYLLANFKPDDEPLVKGYTSLLDDSEAFLRGLGVQAVRKMNRDDQVETVPRLAKMLAAKQEPSEENRAALSRLLGSLKQEAKGSLEALAAGAKNDESPKVRGAHLVAISQIAAPAEALPAFRQGLADQDATVRLVAAARLRLLGKDAAPAAAELSQALEDGNGGVRESAAEALVLLGSAAVDPLIKHVDSKNAATRQLAIACLGKLGADAKSALPHVEKHLTDEDPQVKKVAEAVARNPQGLELVSKRGLAPSGEWILPAEKTRPRGA